MPLVKLESGQVVDLPADATLEQLRAVGAPVSTGRAFEMAEREAIDAVFNELNPFEKIIVGFRGATRSAAAGISEALGIDPEGVARFEARERPALEAVARNPGFGTLGDLVPNIAAGAGGHIRSSIAEGLLEASQAPEGQGLATGVQAGFQNLIFGKVLEKGFKAGSSIIKTRRVAREAREAAGDLGDQVVRDVDLITATDRASPVGELVDRAPGIADELTATTQAAGGAESVGLAERARLSTRADELGIQVTAGQRYGNRQRQQLEVSLASNPITSRPFSEIAENNAIVYAQRANAAIGETGDAITPAVLGNATERLGNVFSDIGAQLDEVLPDALTGIDVPRSFLSRLRIAARRELGDIRNQAVTRSGAIERVSENLRVGPMVDVIQARLREGTLSGKQLMSIRSSLVDEMSQLRRGTGGGAAQGSQIFAMGDMVDAIDNLIVDAAAAGGKEALAAEYAVARSQWRVLQALENSRALDNVGAIRARTVDSALRREYPIEYRRGGLTGDVAGRSPEVQALADFFDATRIGASVTQDIVGNSGTATRAFVGDLLTSDITPRSMAALASRATVGRMVGSAVMAAPSGVPGAAIAPGVLQGVRGVVAAGTEPGTIEDVTDRFEDVLGNLLQAVGLGESG